MENFYFWDSEVWGIVSLISVLFLTMLVANVLKKNISFLQKSLIPTSVLGGLILFAVSAVFEGITGKAIFNTKFFGGNGSSVLEIITYHALALGFIATTLKNTDKKFTKKRTNEIFNTGVTTVACYLVQAVVGMGITILVAATFIPDLFPASGVLLPFGYGQGTGQALNWGTTYENDYGFLNGSSIYLCKSLPKISAVVLLSCDLFSRNNGVPVKPKYCAFLK